MTGQHENQRSTSVPAENPIITCANWAKCKGSMDLSVLNVHGPECALVLFFVTQMVVVQFLFGEKKCWKGVLPWSGSNFATDCSFVNINATWRLYRDVFEAVLPFDRCGWFSCHWRLTVDTNLSMNYVLPLICFQARDCFFTVINAHGGVICFLNVSLSNTFWPHIVMAMVYILFPSL